MKKYSSKILLFGEHSVIKGSQALAMPLPNFYGKWEMGKKDFERLQMNLSAFTDYLEKLQHANELLCELDLVAFKAKLRDGLFFKSNIPTGYGVGSSGALCAAVYDAFGKNKLNRTTSNFLTLKKIFAQLESFFHGSSSGTDPLICFLEKSLLLESTNEIKVVQMEKKNDLRFFLLDTQIPRETSPLVNLFLEKCKNKSYFRRVQAELNPAVDDAISALLSNHVNVLFESIHHIAHFQFKYFLEMIPTAFRSIWLDGLVSDYFKLKLCGAGGGGFILGITYDFEKTKQVLSSYDLIPILE